VSQIAIAISTTSSVINWSPNSPNLPPAQPPSITVNNLAITPSQPAYSPTGYQLVIFDITQTIPTPASIQLNTYISLYPNEGSNTWVSIYDCMYGQIITSLLGAGNPANQLVILASYGLDANMGPDNDMWAMLLGYGAGEQLQNWLKSADTGSQVGNSTSWVSFPANYIFVGLGGIGYGHGNEIFQAAGSSNSVTTPLNVTLQPDSVMKRRQAAG